MFVDISAEQGTNIDGLLEAILLTADAALDLRANPDMEAQGVAIEAHLDRGRGPVATVLVQRGTLRVGDSIVAGDAYGRVRRMVDEHNEDVTEATPSRPVQVIGFTSVPGAGDTFLVVDEDRVARQIAERRAARTRNALNASRPQAGQPGGPGRRAEGDQPAQPDHQGRQLGHRRGARSRADEASTSATRSSCTWSHRGVGGVTESDIDLATASNAIVLGFNVRAEGKATERATREGVDVRYYTVIYQAIDEIEQALKGMLKPEYEEVAAGPGGGPRGLQVLQGRHDRGLPGDVRRDPAQRARPGCCATASWCGEPDDQLAASVQGRRDRGPRGLRVRSDARQLQRPARSATSSRRTRCARSRARSRSSRRAAGPATPVRSRHADQTTVILPMLRRCARAGRPARGRPFAEAEAIRGPAGAGRDPAQVRGRRWPRPVISTCTAGP